MAHQPRVLLVDPDPTSRAAAMAVLLDAGINVVASVGTAEEALAVAPAAQPTLAILDLAIPGIGPAETGVRLRDLLGYRLDIVAQAAFSDLEHMGRMVSTGTSAFIVKGKLGDLVAAVRAVAAGSGLLSAEASRPLLEEVQRRYEAEQARTRQLEGTVERLQAVSITDWLTGLKNHGFFWDRLAEEIQRARRYDRPLAVIMADIDDFKAVNDAFGHGAGDEVLRAAGGAILHAVRESDIPCRVGGEEFAVLIPETDAEGALMAAERIRMAVHDVVVDPVGSVTISLGVAVFPFHADTGQDLVEAADRALYEAKRSGKNRTHLVGGGAVRRGGAGGSSPVVKALLGALGLRAPQLVEHAERIADVAIEVGNELKMTVADLERLRVAALLHDVGMLGVPDAVLQKEGSLTEFEWAQVRRHPEHGVDLARGAVHEDVLAAVRHHHERFDGTGYPDGLAGDLIPRFATVLAVADAYNAMTMVRPYQAPRTEAQAYAEIASHAGSQFDPDVVAALARVLGVVEQGDNVVAFRRAAGSG